MLHFFIIIIIKLTERRTVMKQNRSNVYNWLFTLLLALVLMACMSAAAFAEDGSDANGESNDVIWFDPNGGDITITVADQWTDVVLGVPTLDETTEMHFWTDNVCPCATLSHMDGSYYDSGFNGFNLTDVGFQGESYYLHCSVVDGYKDMTYTVHYAVNDWASGNDAADQTVKGLKVKSKKKKKAAVSWTPNKTVYGYAIQYSTNSKFKKAKTKKILRTAKTLGIHNTTVSKLKSKKVYYFRIAPIMKDLANGTVIQGKWSKKTKVKIK